MPRKSIASKGIKYRINIVASTVEGRCPKCLDAWASFKVSKDDDVENSIFKCLFCESEIPLHIIGHDCDSSKGTKSPIPASPEVQNEKRTLAAMAHLRSVMGIREGMNTLTSKLRPHPITFRQGGWGMNVTASFFLNGKGLPTPRRG